MTNEDKSTQTGSSQQSGADAWREVGRQFQALGESLGAALRMTLDTPEHRQRTQEMRTGVEAMVNEVERAIRQAAESPEGQKVRAHAAKAATSVRAASEQTAEEVRPHVLATLRQLNAELQRMVSRMEQEEQETPPEK